MNPKDRSFHDDATSIYSLPNDTPEHARLNEQAKHIDTVMFHKVLQSPIEDIEGARLLDVGCGTGYMTYRLALKFPSAEVFGLDLSSVPRRESRLANVHFLQGNILNQRPTEWKPQENGPGVPRDEEAFDLLIGRFLIAGIHDWPSYIKIQFRLLRSGGWCEMHELDPLVYNKAGETNTHNEDWHTVPEKAAGELGPEYGCASRAASRMADAGFVDITAQEYQLPLGGAGEETPELQAAGDFFDRTFMDVREMILRTYVKENQEALDRLLSDMRREMAPEPGKHCKMIVTFGRKP